MYKFKKYKNWLLIVLACLVLAYQLFNEYQPRSGSAAGSGEHQNTLLVQLFEQKRSDQFLTVQGKVYRVLRDDTKGSQHQRFLIYVNNISVLVAHNIDLAPRVPLQVGDTVTLHGEYEYTHKGGVLHWTHHDPKGRRAGGWIDHEGQRYK